MDSLDSLIQDLRYAVRMLIKHRGFTAVAILTLALGIGANAAIFSVLDGVMLRPLPYPDVDRLLVFIEQTRTGEPMSVAYPNFEDYRDQNQTFESIGVTRPAVVNLTGADQPERLNGSLASSGVFTAMGIAPLAGRTFTAAEDRAGTEPVAVISERLWRSHFNGDPAIVGRALTLNGQPHTVVGIMPAAMRFPSRLTDVWLPLGLFVPTFPPRGAHPGLSGVGKMKPSVTVQQAMSDLDTVARRIAQQYPDSSKNLAVRITPYYESVVQSIRPALFVLIAAVAFVLLIGCANLANLMLSKAEARQREIAIRSALGADRWRIIQQLLTESVLLAGAGGVIGALLATWAVKAFVASRPTTVPRVDLLTVDGRVLAFVAAISIVTGILFGLVPALRASAPDLLTALKESVRGSASVAARRFRSALVVSEVALALMLLVGAGLMIRSFGRLMAIDPGFTAERVVTMRVSLPNAKYPTRAAWTIFHEEMLRRVRTLPAIDAVGLNSAVPLEGGGFESPVIAEGQPMPSPDRPGTQTLFQASSPEYFRAMGIQVLEGRTFTDRDTADSTPVAVVDELLARKFFPDTDPIGKRIAFEFTGHNAADSKPLWREIIGVVRHVRHYGMATEPPFVQVYTPFVQLPYWMLDRRPSMALVARTTLPPEAVAASIRREVSSIDRDIPVFAVQTMEGYVAQNTEQPRLSVMLLTGFGALALLLSVVGIYGVLSYSVSQRTQEIGIRMALGATRRDVLGLVVGHGMLLTAIGIAIGLAASSVVTRSMAALLFQVSPHDPATFVVIAALLGSVALVASVLPGLRATRVSPIQALRYE
jgi:putative ABC transport system permease protein